VKIAVQHAIGDPGWRPSILAPAAVTEFARLAEEGGYSALGFSDHPAPTLRWTAVGGEGSADPFVSLGFCAAVTSTIRLLTFVLALPYRNPLLLAHQVTTLDVLSAGRLTLGLGTGYLKGELRALGADPAQRREQFDEALATLLAAWTEPAVTAEGRGWSARGVHIQPRVLQQPHPPLWLHGNGPFGRERAARSGQGCFVVVTDEVLAATMRTTPVTDLNSLAAAVTDLRIRTEKAGREATAVEVGVAGIWPMLDVRKGWNAARMLDEATQLAELGVETILVLVAGDDPIATNDTVTAFAEQVVRPLGR
jgi:probable F420-dependent oxidoreductase